MANPSIYAAFERMWQHISAKLNTKADSDHTHSYNDLEDLLVGYISGDTLTWDGATSFGPVVVTDAGEFYTSYHYIADVDITSDDVANGFKVTHCGDDYTCDKYSVTDSTYGIMFDTFAVYAKCDNADIEGHIYPKKGLYFNHNRYDDEFTSSFTIEGYTGFKSEKPLETKWLEPFEFVGSDTLTWDGNTTGKTVVDGVLVKVSDSMPTLAEFQNGGTLYMETYGSGVEMPITTDENPDIQYVEYNDAVCMMAGGMPFVIVAFSDNAYLDDLGGTIPEKGLYFINSSSVVKSLTINGYTGFGSKKLKKEYIPDHAHSYNDLEDLLVGYVGCDTLTWDGNTSGLIAVNAMEEIGMIAYYMSDATISDEDVVNGFSPVFAGESVELGADAISSDDDVIIFADFAIYAKKDNANYNNVTYPNKGVYFVYYDTVNYTASLTINGYAGFKSEKQLETKWLEPFESVSGDTLTWDGNTSGLTNVFNIWYKVSDTIVNIDHFVNGGSITIDNNSIDYTADDCWELVPGTGVLFVCEYAVCVSEEGVGLDLGDGFTFTEAGVYFMNSDDAITSSLTINGYTGFGSNKLKMEYLPDGVEDVITKSPRISDTYKGQGSSMAGGRLAYLTESDGSLLKLKAENLTEIIPVMEERMRTRVDIPIGDFFASINATVTESEIYQVGNHIYGHIKCSGSASTNANGAFAIGRINEAYRPVMRRQQGVHYNSDTGSGDLYTPATFVAHKTGWCGIYVGKANSTIGNSTYPWCDSEGLQFDYEL